MIFLYYARIKNKEGKVFGCFGKCNKTKNPFVQVACMREDGKKIWDPRTQHCIRN